MNARIINIQHDDSTYSVEIWDDGDAQVATVKKDGTDVAERRLKKDQDIEIDLRDIIESDIKNGKI